MDFILYLKLCNRTEKFILIVGGAERSFHNLIHGVQEATPQQ